MPLAKRRLAPVVGCEADGRLQGPLDKGEREALVQAVGDALGRIDLAQPIPRRCVARLAGLHAPAHHVKWVGRTLCEEPSHTTLHDAVPTHARTGQARREIMQVSQLSTQEVFFLPAWLVLWDLLERGLQYVSKVGAYTR